MVENMESENTNLKKSEMADQYQKKQTLKQRLLLGGDKNKDKGVNSTKNIIILNM